MLALGCVCGGWKMSVGGEGRKEGVEWVMSTHAHTHHMHLHTHALAHIHTQTNIHTCTHAHTHKHTHTHAVVRGRPQPVGQRSPVPKGEEEGLQAAQLQ